MFMSLVVAASNLIASAGPIEGIPVGEPIIGMTYDQVEMRFGRPSFIIFGGLGSPRLATFHQKTGLIDTAITVTLFNQTVSTVQYRHRIRFAGTIIRF